MKRVVYLDHSATTPVKPAVLEAMLPYFTEQFGNASSIHQFGRPNKAKIAEARETLAKTLNAKTEELYFTAGGTESDNWALKSVAEAYRSKGNHIITTKIEHHAILHTAEYLEKNGCTVTYLDVDSDGLISLEALKAAITDKTILISVMFVNNEIGTVQPIAEIGRIAKEHGVLFHTDAVQAYGNMPIDVNAMNIDLLSLSAHKVYGPKGIGLLYARQGVRLPNFIHGGAQERKRRAGTENVPGIIGFAKAAELAHEGLEGHMLHLKTLRDKLIDRVLKEIPYSRLNGHAEHRHPGNANISFEFIEGEALLLSLDMVGVAGSSGSACTSGSLDPSHVLMAIGLTHEIAHGSLRLTMGDSTTEADIDYTVDQLKIIVDRLRQMSPLYEKITGGK